MEERQTNQREIIIRTENLCKRYGTYTAVNSLDLTLEKGEIFGLLGPNGAGKTTTILMLLGLTEPSSGQAWIADYDPTRQPLEVKSLVGYLPDNVGFYEDLTARENLRYTGRLNGLGKEEIEAQIEMLLARVGLTEASDKKVGVFSRGMRQRLGIADVLMKKPKVVILDEPTLGIDPQGVNELLDIIKELAHRDGLTVLISSHLLHQVQQICDRVGIFVKGNLVAEGPIETLGEQVAKSGIQVLEIKALPEDESLTALLNDLPGVTAINRDRGVLTITSTTDIREILVQKLFTGGYQLQHLRLRGGDLDDIYRRYFAREEVI